VRHKAGRRQRGWRCTRGSFGCDGSVAAEFALVAPVILVITAGIVDFGLLTTKAAALAGATRIGGEYARLHPTDTTGIQNAMQNSMSFTPPLTFPASFPRPASAMTRPPSLAPLRARQAVVLAPTASSSGSAQIRLPPRGCRGREFPGL
jgi:hypothetical protein